MKIMDIFDDDLSSKQKEFEEPLEKAINKDLFEQKDKFKVETPEVFYPNSLITKNISLFYKRSKL